MDALEQFIQSVETAPSLDAGKKSLLVVFLRAAGPTIAALGESGFRSLLGTAAAGGTLSQTVIDQLDAPGVAALLTLTNAQMSQLADQHAAQAQAARAAMETLQSAALTALAQALIAAL